MRVLLVNPPATGDLEPWYDQPVYGRTGLAYLAGYLRQFSDYDVNIIDAKLERLNFEQVVEKIRLSEPDVVGLTAFTNEIKPAAYVAAKIKNLAPSIKTIIGGVHLTALPIQCLEEFPSFDFGVYGEGEETLKELCDAFKNKNTNYGSIPGVVFRDGQNVKKSLPRQRSIDLDEMPLPAWDLMPAGKTYYVQTQRGCPFNCVFCMNPNGLTARLRSPENVIKELNWIIDTYQPKQISFGDELWSVNLDRTHELLDLMIEHDIGSRVNWEVQTHVKFVNDELFAKMKRANVHLCELGIESGDDSKLSKLGKGSSLKLIEQACASAHRHNVPFGTFFIIGHPNETVESIRKTIDLAVRVNPNVPMFGIMVPYPGTEVSRLAAKEEGGYRLITTNWDEYNKQLGGAMEFSSLTRRQIEFLQIEAYTKVFLKNRRVVEFAKVFWQYQKGAWSLLKKALSGKEKLTDLLRFLPDDYEEVLKSHSPLTKDQFIEARSEWKQWQKEELIRMKKLKPSAVKIKRRAGAPLGHDAR